MNEQQGTIALLLMALVLNISAAVAFRNSKSARAYRLGIVTSLAMLLGYIGFYAMVSGWPSTAMKAIAIVGFVYVLGYNWLWGRPR